MDKLNFLGRDGIGLIRGGIDRVADDNLAAAGLVNVAETALVESFDDLLIQFRPAILRFRQDMFDTPLIINAHLRLDRPGFSRRKRGFCPGRQRQVMKNIRLN